MYSIHYTLDTIQPPGSALYLFPSRDPARSDSLFPLFMSMSLIYVNAVLVKVMRKTNVLVQMN